MKYIYKILLYIIFFLIFIYNLLFSECVCYYNTDHVCCQNTCEYYARILDKNCEIRPFNGVIYPAKDITILAGFGSYYGFFIPGKPFTLDVNSVLPWSNIAKLNTNLLVIDACYAGYIFDYDLTPNIVATSTGKENSWNVLYDSEGKNVGSLAVALNCMYNKDYQCPVNCKNTDINTCQLRVILWTIKYQYSQQMIDNMELFDWEYPSLGTLKLWVKGQGFIKIKGE